MDQEPSKQKNRRTSIRRKPRRSTKLVCQRGSVGLGRNIAVSILDISETGACLILNTELEKGQPITIEISTMRRSRPSKTEAEVVWCVKLADGNYAAGVQFRKYLRFADVLEM